MVACVQIESHGDRRSSRLILSTKTAARVSLKKYVFDRRIFRERDVLSALDFLECTDRYAAATICV